MKLKNILLVVNDMERSKEFYRELFGLEVIRDFGENVILTEGLVLQERKVWEKSIGQSVQFRGNDAELYFEENNMDTFLAKLEEYEKSGFQVKYLREGICMECGRRVIRLYDLDNHVIEIGEPL